MAPRKCKGTPLKVFSGKEATLNRVILLILCSPNQALARYDIYLHIRNMKGLKHTDSKSVYRRIVALREGNWITQNGTRPAKVKGDTYLYQLTPKGKAALELDSKSVEEFLRNATEEQLNTFIKLFSP